MLCRKCGATFSQGDSFCATCGYDLGATALLTALAEHAERPPIEIVREALQGDYDVKHQIGRGGMGLVFRALERNLKREVALKVLPFAQVHDGSFVERFTNEARTAAKLEHPNIVPVYRVGRSGDVIFFTMRYLTGPSLAELILESGSLAPHDIRRILLECAEALGYAHSHGVVHRDVKPDNVMFKESGEVVVCDFGIARAASNGNLTGTGMAIGTPYYMSPEQFRARPLDGRSDIYSLGVVGYQCLTKELPFLGEDSFAIGYKHVTEPLPKPQLKTAEHRALYDVIARMMEKDPAHRYPNAAALMDDLRDGASADRSVTSISRAVTVVDGLPAVSELPTVAAAPIKPPTPTTPLPRRGASGGIRRPGHRQRSHKRTGFGMAAFATVVLGGIGGGSFWYIQSAGGAQPAYQQARTSLTTQLARVPWIGNWVQPVADETATQSEPENQNPQTSVASAEGADFLAVPMSPGDSFFDSLSSDSTYQLLTAADSLAFDPSDMLRPVPGGPSGTLLINGIGRGRLTINGEPRFGLEHFLPEGAHQLAVTALGYAPYQMEIIVQAGDTVRHQVVMVKTSHCDDLDENYNALGECFDERPTLPDDQSLFVPLDETVPVQPTLPAELKVLVRADGSVGLIHMTRPSDVQAFTLLAIEFTKTLRFQPARKRGQNVDAWISLQLYAER